MLPWGSGTFAPALHPAGAITANAMRDWVTGGEHDDMNAAELEKLFLSLS